MKMCYFCFTAVTHSSCAIVSDVSWGVWKFPWGAVLGVKRWSWCLNAVSFANNAKLFAKVAVPIHPFLRL
jgi:hypothetical protein